MGKLFRIVGILCVVAAFLIDLQAKSEILQILAHLGYLIAAIIVVAAEVIVAIKKPPLLA